MERRGMRRSAARQLQPEPAPVQKPAEDKPAQVLGIFEIRCSICRMSKAYPDLYTSIHELRFKQRKTYSQIMGEVNLVIVEQKLDLKPLKHSSFTAHFASHVPADTAFLQEVQSQHAMREGGTHRPPQDSRLMAQVLEYKRENVEQMQQNLNRWQKILTSVYNQTELTVEPMTLTAMRNVSVMREATGAIAQITASMDRFVNSKDFIIGVLSAGIDHLGRQLSLRLGAELGQIQQDAAKEESDPEAIALWIRNRLAETLMLCLKDGKEDTCQAMVDQYKLSSRG
jgi:hypothetical protein